jgi:predicted DNA-binding transcriptional regulator AlpA
MSRLTVLQAATYVGLAKSTLNHMRTAGKGPRFLKLGTRVVYDTKDLDAWLDRNKRTSTSDQPELRRPRRRSRNLVNTTG